MPKYTAQTEYLMGACDTYLLRTKKQLSLSRKKSPLSPDFGGSSPLFIRWCLSYIGKLHYDSLEALTEGYKDFTFTNANIFCSMGKEMLVRFSNDLWYIESPVERKLTCAIAVPDESQTKRMVDYLISYCKDKGGRISLQQAQTAASCALKKHIGPHINLPYRPGGDERANLVCGFRPGATSVRNGKVRIPIVLNTSFSVEEAEERIKGHEEELYDIAVHSLRIKDGRRPIGYTVDECGWGTIIFSLGNADDLSQWRSLRDAGQRKEKEALNFDRLSAKDS